MQAHYRGWIWLGDSWKQHLIHERQVWALGRKFRVVVSQSLDLPNGFLLGSATPFPKRTGCYPIEGSASLLHVYLVEKGPQ